MSDFPTLEPAFTLPVVIDNPVDVGSASRGTPLTMVPITGGSMKSEPGFSPEIDAEIKLPGNDYTHNDNSGKYMRLNAHSVLENTDGALIYINYQGIVEIENALTVILKGNLKAMTTPFGHCFTHITFETGTEEYQDLETSRWTFGGREGPADCGRVQSEQSDTSEY